MPNVVSTILKWLIVIWHLFKHVPIKGLHFEMNNDFFFGDSLFFMFDFGKVPKKSWFRKCSKLIKGNTRKQNRQYDLMMILVSFVFSHFNFEIGLEMMPFLSLKDVTLANEFINNSYLIDSSNWWFVLFQRFYMCYFVMNHQSSSSYLSIFNYFTSKKN